MAAVVGRVGSALSSAAATVASSAASTAGAAATATYTSFLEKLPIVLAVGTLAIIGALSVATLIPLDSVPAVTGVTIITAVAYAISIIMWIVSMTWFKKEDRTDLINHMMWLVVFPATVAATAMNVTTVQNTRNLLAGKVSA